MLIAHRIALAPNNAQATYLVRAAAIIQLGQAFQNFFAGRARYPVFRRKGVHERFSLTNDQFSLDGSRIRIPKLGWVRTRETLRFAGKIMSATVSRVADRSKVKARLARLHARIAAIRADATHKLTTDLTRRFHTIGIEDLNVRGMLTNRHLARSIAAMAFGEVRRQLQYKALMRGGEVQVADRFYASSKTWLARCEHRVEPAPAKQESGGKVNFA